jgi:hypothetical protein
MDVFGKKITVELESMRNQSIQMVRASFCIIAAVMLLWLVGLRYCVHEHGLQHYGHNRANNTLADPPPRILRATYDPALRALASYYAWRDPGIGPDDPWDIRVLDWMLFD